jgi:hypothetical protein
MREPFALWQPFRTLPELEVALHHGGTTETELILERTETIRPIDRRAVVNEQGNVARETVEARPPPPEPRGLFTPPSYDFRESYDDALARFNSELEEFGRELGAWLLAYESRRWPTASYVEAWLRIENRGGAPADDSSVELELPEELNLASPPRTLTASS